MQKINILPENLINQIAAGEVVERPASVVKELVENSLDAGARRMIIEVNDGGDSFIRITDDGCGMCKEDALLAFERHATSKITSADDLFNILTLGFRGEAIATIASVSYMSIQTKEKGQSEGTFIVCEGGKMEKVKQLGCPEGTQIEVRQLFYNTPARKKYLKNDATEYGHVLETVTGIALAYPEVAFKFVHDGKVVFDLPATEDQLMRIRALHGRSIANELVPVFYGHSDIELHGYIGKPLLARSNRRSQYFYVNRRQVTSHVLSYAVKQSYYSLLPKEKQPVFFLFMRINPQLVDVNVHPRKLEVRFTNEKEIFGILTRACQKALEKHVLAPGIHTEEEESGLAYERRHQPLTKVSDKPLSVPDYSVVVPGLGVESNTEELSVGGMVEEKRGGGWLMSEEPGVTLENKHDGAEGKSGGGGFGVITSEEMRDTEVLEGQEQSSYIQRSDTEALIPLAQLANSYILCQQGESLVVVDQHAAHERIRYTEILEDFESKKSSVQPLLTPEQLELSHLEAALLEENRDLLKEMGFEIEPFGGNTFSVFAVPSYMVKENIQSTILGLIDDINDNTNKGDFQTRKEKALTYAACRSAVKFGDPLSMEEMKKLCERLVELDLPYTCPHGRPTMVTMTFDELEKRFGRRY